MRYSDDIIEEVIHRNDIVELIGENVRLKRNGSNYMGLCPFHNEKTPSFSVSPSKQVYYCFGCHAGGNIITFLMEYYNYTFVEALQFLADRAGMQLPEQELTEEQKAASDRRQKFLELYKLSATFYYHRLKQPSGEAGLSYLKERGLNDETIRRFGLGYADKYGNSLYRYVKSKGYDDDFLRDSGLFRFDEQGGARDLFYNRVMFPIQDVRGRVIAFGGRVMGDGKPKYLNSPETFIFNKRRNLYALNYARSTRRGYLILCEGYMDVITMHQAGFTNACASLGTALTEEQCTLMKRYTGEARLLYDSDGAGVNAALRAIPLLKDAGIRSRVVNLRPSKDPDELIRASGAEELEKRLEASENAFLFEAEQIALRYHKGDPGEWTAFQHEIAKKLITDFPEDLERGNYLSAVCARFGIDADAMRKLVAREARAGTSGNAGRGVDAGLYRGDRRRGDGSAYGNARRSIEGSAAENNRHSMDDSAAGRPGRDGRRVKEDSGVKTQQLMLSYLSRYPEAYALTRNLIGPEDYPDGLMRRIADILYRQLEEGHVSEAALLTHFPESEDQRAAAGVFHRTIPVRDGSELDQAFTDTVVRMLEVSMKADYDRAATDLGSMQNYMEKKRQHDRVKSGRPLHLNYSEREEST